MAGGTQWFYWALWSAVFAALTAIFAKLGLEGVDSDLATLVRTAVIIVVLAGFVYATGKWSNPLDLAPKTWRFLVLSGLATGASWVCYFRALKIGDASKVAPVDKLTSSWWQSSRCCSSASGRRAGSGWASSWSEPAF
jgi:bacterial/archaeal transporter family protein